MPPGHTTRAFRFGPFEADVVSGQLRKWGRIVRLQDQPFQLLLAFLARPGALLTRRDIRRALWPCGLNVDFDHSINNAVNRLRAALGDLARQSQLIENVPRRGYRFIAPVECVSEELHIFSPRLGSTHRPSEK